MYMLTNTDLNIHAIPGGSRPDLSILYENYQSIKPIAIILTKKTNLIELKDR